MVKNITNIKGYIEWSIAFFCQSLLILNDSYRTHFCFLNYFYPLKNGATESCVSTMLPTFCTNSTEKDKVVTL